MGTKIRITTPGQVRNQGGNGVVCHKQPPKVRKFNLDFLFWISLIINNFTRLFFSQNYLKIYLSRGFLNFCRSQETTT